MTGVDARLRRYARSIERTWTALADRAIVLSPRDFRLIADWCERGVPLELVGEALREACDRRRDGQAPRRLSAIAPLVEESWSTIVEGRVTSPDRHGTLPDGGEQPAGEVVEAWRRRAASGSTPAPIRRRLEALLDEFDAGADPARLDERLDRALVTLLPPSIDDAVRRTVDQRLEAHRERLGEAAFSAARRRALEAARRRALGIPRLTVRPVRRPAQTTDDGC